jgi:hypothetical protein
MIEFLQRAIAQLAGIDPSAPWALLALCIFAVVYCLRKLFPVAWERFAHIGILANIDPMPVVAILRKLWQSVPGQLLGVAIGAIGSGGDVKAALLGALAGIVASLSHEILKAAPWIPYKGSTK